jgi:hypothetical protein
VATQKHLDEAVNALHRKGIHVRAEVDGGRLGVHVDKTSLPAPQTWCAVWGEFFGVHPVLVIDGYDRTAFSSHPNG